MLWDKIVNILLVEDNDDHAELVIRSFEANAVSIDTIYRVVDGEEALRFVRKIGQYTFAPTPGVVFLDINLPKINGLEVLREIKESEELKKIPVVMLTSSKAGTDIDNAYSHYANSYIEKPLDFNKFTELMKELKFYWVCSNINTNE